MRIMAGHQPNFLPYPGFFDKIRTVGERGDKESVFIITGFPQYSKRDYHCRNKIRIHSGWKWINVPVYHKKAPINDIRIRHEQIKGMPWNEFKLNDIKDQYSKTKYFDKFFPGIKEIFLNPGDSLNEFNKKIILYLVKCFNLKTKILILDERPQDLKGNDATETIINMTKYVGANTYLSGGGAKTYLDESKFGSEIKLLFHEYKPPIYSQKYSGFEPYMSAIDVLFNVGRLPYSGEVVEVEND